MSYTVGDIIDQARSRHPLLAGSAAPDGAVLLALDARQRWLLLRYGASVDGLVGASVSIATTINGVLVGSSDGVPVFITTVQDGWATHQTVDGVPYWDFSEAPIAGDPFGEHGGTPGFPLPANFVKLINASVTYQSGATGPLQVVAESVRHGLRGNTPGVFLSGNRLVPIRPLASGNTGDVWASSITSLELSYVALPVLTARTDTLVLPATMIELLVTGMAAYLATFSPTMPASDRQAFQRIADQVMEDFEAFSTDVVGAATTNTVQFRR